MLIEIESYEEFKEHELRFHKAFSKDSYIKQSEDGRELLYSGDACQVTDLRKSYEKYCKNMKDIAKRIEKFREKYEKNTISKGRVHEQERVGVGLNLLAHRRRAE